MTESQFAQALLDLGFKKSCMHAAPARLEYTFPSGREFWIYTDSVTDFDESLKRIERHINGSLERITEESK